MGQWHAVSPLATAAFVAGLAGSAHAHLPYMVADSGVTLVERPEVSKAYYAELHGEPAVYQIVSPDSFDLYVNVLVPEGYGIPPDVSVTLTHDADTVAVLDGPGFTWTEFYEPFGGESYLRGPEVRLRAGAGSYVATVWRPGNSGRYVLAIGEREEFTPREFFRVIRLLPRLKRDFFKKASIRALTDPIGSLFRRQE